MKVRCRRFAMCFYAFFISFALLCFAGVGVCFLSSSNSGLRAVGAGAKIDGAGADGASASVGVCAEVVDTKVSIKSSASVEIGQCDKVSFDYTGNSDKLCASEFIDIENDSALDGADGARVCDTEIDNLNSGIYFDDVSVRANGASASRASTGAGAVAVADLLDNTPTYVNTSVGADGVDDAKGNTGECVNTSAVALGTVEEREISPAEMDWVLYCYLMFVRDGVYPDAEAEEYVKLKTTDFADLVSLDLSDVRDGEYRITDVSGLGLFDFGNLRELNLSNNYLTEIPSKTFAGMVSLDLLDVRGNNLTTLDISTLESVGTLLAQNSDDDFSKSPRNKLTAVDLSKIASGGVAKLAFNCVEDVAKLNLKADGQGASVDLYGNYISNFNAENYSNYDFVIGFQKQKAEYTEKSLIKVYRVGEQNFWLACINQTTQEKVVISDSGYLMPATYKVLLEGESGYLAYSAVTIVIKKSAPTFEIVDADGNAVDIGQYIKSAVKITFNSNDPNYVVEYSINGSSFIKGNSVRLDKNGSYSFAVRAVSDAGDQSQVYAFTVVLSMKSGNFWQTLAIVLSVFVLVGLIYFAIWLFNNKPKLKLPKIKKSK